MTLLAEYASQSSTPKRILRYLQREGLIGDPLSRDDQLRLQFLEKIWGRKEIIRAQLSRMPLKARLHFLRTADLPTKWERYASTRYQNLAPGQKLKMARLVEEIQTTFGFILSRQQIGRLHKVRNRVHVARSRKKNRIAELGSRPLTEHK